MCLCTVRLHTTTQIYKRLPWNKSTTQFLRNTTISLNTSSCLAPSPNNTWWFPSDLPKWTAWDGSKRPTHLQQQSKHMHTITWKPPRWSGPWNEQGSTDGTRSQLPINAIAGKYEYLNQTSLHVSTLFLDYPNLLPSQASQSASTLSNQSYTYTFWRSWFEKNGFNARAIQIVTLKWLEDLNFKISNIQRMFSKTEPIQQNTVLKKQNYSLLGKIK